MPQLTKCILPVYGALALYSMVDFSCRNGYIPMVMEKGQQWLNAPPTDPRKRAQTTGIASLDEPLATMFVFYWPLLDGSYPSLSLMFVNYFGTITLSLVLGTLESLRKGNRTSGLSLFHSPTLWGMIGVAVTLAISVPWYLTVHLFLSTTASQPTADNLSIPVRELKALIANVTFGLMLPCLVVALPERLTWSLFTRQSAISLWQLWPFWSTGVHYVARFFISSNERDTGSRAHWERTRSAFRAVYGLTFAVAAITHIGTWTISLTAATGLRNALDAETVAALHPSTIFMNTAPWSSVKTDSVGEGTLWLIQWDQAFAAGAMWWWALDLYRAAHAAQGRKIAWGNLALKTVVFCMVSGFTGAAVELLWEREEMVLEGGEVVEERK
ncbi:hypothetical protein BJY04DRAFT_223623 [Aspergillus karnatakaensis]|uniref:uncharacterized protein n=1 Tax=Aspergillus karnatakaensis TaxID=1810916 RepID=UPI003CCDA761